MRSKLTLADLALLLDKLEHGFTRFLRKEITESDLNAMLNEIHFLIRKDIGEEQYVEMMKDFSKLEDWNDYMNKALDELKNT